MQRSRGNRTGRNFTVRISEAQFAAFKAAGFGNAGPAALGPWLVDRALTSGPALPELGIRLAVGALPEPGPGNARPGRIVLDLCGGSGAWSRPYVDAGYDVRLLTLPEFDVRAVRLLELALPGQVHGVLAAPPCKEFSIRKTRGSRDFASALEVVVACLRLVGEARPRWWALENPGSGLLRRWLGPPTDVFQPHDFGDPHSKLTALWGCFALPLRRHCRRAAAMPGRSSAERAVTPAGFARAFFEANP